MAEDITRRMQNLVDLSSKALRDARALALIPPTVRPPGYVRELTERITHLEWGIDFVNEEVARAKRIKEKNAQRSWRRRLWNWRLRYVPAAQWDDMLRTARSKISAAKSHLEISSESN